MNCPTCDYPMVWSSWHERVVCAVYGRHLDQREDWRHSPIADVIRLDLRRQIRSTRAPSADNGTHHG